MFSAASLILSRCLTDQYQITYLSVKCINPFIITGIFIITTADQKCWTVHCLNAFNCSIRISSLGIIIIYNTIFLCYIFDSMCNSSKFTDALTDAVHRNSIVVSHCNAAMTFSKLCCPRSLSSPVCTTRNLFFGVFRMI